MRVTSKQRLMLATILATTLCGAQVTMAQAADGKVAAQATGIEEVVVTAQKHAQNLQDVPVSVTALTGNDLKNNAIVNLADISTLVPNLQLQQALSGTTTPKMFLRGVGVVNQVFSFDSPIGLYFDGVYISRVTGALVDLFDVKRVEFLRGPQGTLFGMNSSVGALRIMTKLPVLDGYEGEASLAYGTQNQLNANFAVSAPLIEDKLGLRVTVMTRSNNGFQTDQTGQRFMNNDIHAFRASLLFKPTKDIDIILRGDYLADHSKPTMPYNFRATPATPFQFERTLTAPFRNSVEPWGVSATIIDRMPWAELHSITAFRGLQYRNSQDNDGKASVQSFEVQQQDLNEWQFSQEVYLASDHIGKLPFVWTAGAFYLHEQNNFTWALRIFAPPTTQFFNQKTNTFAPYAQVSYSITDRLSVTGGLRYTYVKKALKATQNLANGTPNTAFAFNNSITARKTNWHASADYKVTDSIMLYVTSGTGFRSGGFNGSARDVPSILSGSFGPETVFNIEGGAKTEWFNNRLRLNVDYFSNDFNGLQQAITQSDGTITTKNVKATVTGIEAELSAIPFDGMEITGTLGTMNGKIKNSSLKLQDTPSLQWRLGAAYTFLVGDNGSTLRIGGDVSHSGSYFNTADNVPTGKVAAYENFNAQIIYTPPDGRWQFMLSGTNLSNHVYSTHTFDIAKGFIASVDYPSTPRQWLATVRYKF